MLLHSNEKEESEEPARRLREFVTRNAELGIAVDSLEKIPHDNFDAVKQRLDAIVAEKQLSLKTAINFTGGNKLMAAAAFEWAKESGVPAFYLERGNKLFQFRFEGHRTLIGPAETLDSSKTNSFDAIELLTCQLGPEYCNHAESEFALMKRVRPYR